MVPPVPIAFAPHSSSVGCHDTVEFNAGTNSVFGTPDVITGFNASHDLLQFAKR